MSALLLPSMPPDLILRMAFYSSEEGGANQCNMVPHPIVWDFGCMIWVHHFAHNMCERSKLQRALLPKGWATSSQKAFTAGAMWSLYLSSLQ